MIVIGRFRSLISRFDSLQPRGWKALNSAYLPNGKGTISISLQQSSPPDEATITFRDDGISLADIRDGNRHGLGLVDRLMEQIRGSAEVRSDHGTAWTLRFPLRRDDGQRRALAHPSQSAGTATAH